MRSISTRWLFLCMAMVVICTMSAFACAEENEVINMNTLTIESLDSGIAQANTSDGAILVNRRTLPSECTFIQSPAGDEMIIQNVMLRNGSALDITLEGAAFFNGTVEIQNSTFTGNKAESLGGAIYIQNSDAISDSALTGDGSMGSAVFFSNEDVRNGAPGIYDTGSGSDTFSDDISVHLDNVTYSGGNIIGIETGSALQNITFNSGEYRFVTNGEANLVDNRAENSSLIVNAPLSRVFVSGSISVVSVEVGEKASGSEIYIESGSTADIVIINAPNVTIVNNGYIGKLIIPDNLLNKVTISGEGTIGETSDGHEHQWSEWKTVTPATCTENGLERRTCEKCPKEQTRQIPMLGHDFSVDVAAQEATCTADGWTAHKICGRCKEKNADYELIPALGHDFSVDVAAREATCTADGWTAHKICSRCGAKNEAYEEIPAMGHDFGEWGDNTATCTADGTETRTCRRENCETTETRPSAATGHQYVILEGEFWESEIEEDGIVYNAYGHKEQCSVCGNIMNVVDGKEPAVLVPDD